MCSTGYQAIHQKTWPQSCSSKTKLTLKTSALPEAPSHQRTNLTLHDWLHVVAWYDHNQPISQDETVKHFQNLQVDALIFTQSTLSWHLTENGCQHDQAKLASTPTALSSKHMCIVTRPDMEECLRLWVYHMEEKHETVTGPMLIKNELILKTNFVYLRMRGCKVMAGFKSFSECES